MSQTDPIADFLTCIRNAQSAKKPWVDIPSSNLIIRISHVLKEEAFIRDFILVKDDKQGILRLFLKYDDNSFHRYTFVIDYLKRQKYTPVRPFRN